MMERTRASANYISNVVSRLDLGLSLQNSGANVPDEDSWLFRADPVELRLHRRLLVQSRIGAWMIKRPRRGCGSILACLMLCCGLKLLHFLPYFEVLSEADDDLIMEVRTDLPYALGVFALNSMTVFLAMHYVNRDLFLRQLCSFEAITIILHGTAMGLCQMLSTYGRIGARYDVEWVIADMICVVAMIPGYAFLSALDSVRICNKWKIGILLIACTIAGLEYVSTFTTMETFETGHCIAGLQCEQVQRLYLSSISTLVAFWLRAASFYCWGAPFAVVRPNFQEILPDGPQTWFITKSPAPSCSGLSPPVSDQASCVSDGEISKDTGLLGNAGQEVGGRSDGGCEQDAERSDDDGDTDVELPSCASEEGSGSSQLRTQRPPQFHAQGCLDKAAGGEATHGLQAASSCSVSAGHRELSPDAADRQAMRSAQTASTGDEDWEGYPGRGEHTQFSQVLPCGSLGPPQQACTHAGGPLERLALSSPHADEQGPGPLLLGAAAEEAPSVTDETSLGPSTCATCIDTAVTNTSTATPEPCHEMEDAAGIVDAEAIRIVVVEPEASDTTPHAEQPLDVCAAVGDPPSGTTLVDEATEDLAMPSAPSESSGASRASGLGGAVQGDPPSGTTLVDEATENLTMPPAPSAASGASRASTCRGSSGGAACDPMEGPQGCM